MPPLAIAEQFDVLENVRLGFFSSGVAFAVDPFGLEFSKGAFYGSVVPTVSFSALTSISQIDEYT